MSDYDVNEMNFSMSYIHPSLPLHTDTTIQVFIEKTTDVIYLLMRNGPNIGGLTPMLDPETGLPLTYKVWEEKYKLKTGD